MRMLPWRVDITIIGWIHEAIVGATGVPTIALCVHRITLFTTNGRHGSKDVMLIMPSGWTAASSQSCKANWSSDSGRGCCASGTSVKSHETDRENGYENRSPVFSYKRSPSNVFFQIRLWTIKFVKCVCVCVLQLVGTLSLFTCPTLLNRCRYLVNSGSINYSPELCVQGLLKVISPSSPRINCYYYYYY